MATRVPRPAFRTFAITLEGVPSTLSEDMVRKLIEGAVRDAGAVTTIAAPAKPKVKLRARNVRKDNRFPCTQSMTIGGKTIHGCGRTFSSEANRAKHMDLVGGIWSDKSRWPNGCLDAIVPDDLRDDR